MYTTDAASTSLLEPRDDLHEVTGFVYQKSTKVAIFMRLVERAAAVGAAVLPTS